MRTDEFLFVNGYFDSRNKAKQAVCDGKVFVNGKLVTKPSKDVSAEEKNIKEVSSENYVSLGGYKLAKALTDFGFNVEGLSVADIGASTGGFTDCLLQNGAKKVYAVDINDELLHDSLKKDERVFPIIKNAKYLTKNDVGHLDLITADLSFISAKQVLPVFYRLLSENGKVILLIKPQFEIGEKRKFKNGIIKDEKIRKSACKSVCDCAIETGFSLQNLTTAPIKEDKNVEFLVLLAKNVNKSVDFDKLYEF